MGAVGEAAGRGVGGRRAAAGAVAVEWAEEALEATEACEVALAVRWAAAQQVVERTATDVLAGAVAPVEAPHSSGTRRSRYSQGHTATQKLL